MTESIFMLAMQTFAASASADERAVIARISERVHAGRTVYDALNIQTDIRDFVKERQAELDDSEVYAAIQEIKDERAVTGRLIRLPDEPNLCTHNGAHVEFDEEAARGLSAGEIRKRWPRFWGNCPDCGEPLIKYASTAHYGMGDW